MIHLRHVMFVFSLHALIKTYSVQVMYIKLLLAFLKIDHNGHKRHRKQFNF